MKALDTAYSPTSGKASVYSEGKNIDTRDTEPVSIIKTRNVATALYAINTSFNLDVGYHTTANEAMNGSAKKIWTKSMCVEVNIFRRRDVWIARNLLKIREMVRKALGTK